VSHHSSLVYKEFRECRGIRYTQRLSQRVTACCLHLLIGIDAINACQGTERVLDYLAYLDMQDTSALICLVVIAGGSRS
jgi:hypothetical protein